MGDKDLVLIVVVLSWLLSLKISLLTWMTEWGIEGYGLLLLEREKKKPGASSFEDLNSTMCWYNLTLLNFFKKKKIVLDCQLAT